MEDDTPRTHFNDASHIAKLGEASFIQPPTAIEGAVEIGKLWAESVVERLLRAKTIDTWPEWPPFDAAPKRSRRHSARLVAHIHVHVVHPRSREKELRAPEAIARRRRAEGALVRLCYETARTRYAELAAWRIR